MTAHYAPADVALGTPPLVGTMEHAEAEHAAALLVRACASRGNAWQSISPRELGETLKRDIANKTEPIFSLKDNPFFAPDFHSLVRLGYAEWAAQEKGPIRFTDAGLAAMSKWVSGVGSDDGVSR